MKVHKYLLFLLIIFSFIWINNSVPQDIFLNSNAFQDYNYNIQSDVEIVDVKDRYVVINWSIPQEIVFNSFEIIVYDYQQENNGSVWSIIMLNQTVTPPQSGFTLVNYTEANYIYQASKMFTSNFTIYIASENSTTIQSKITGLHPNTNYKFAINLVNTSIIKAEKYPIISILTEQEWWISSSIQTLLDIEQTSNYSRSATMLSLLLIVVLISILFIFLAIKEVPFNRIAYLFIFPAFFALALLEVYPIIYGIILSFYSYHLRRGEIPVFNGLQNYVIIANNPHLPIAFTTTLVWSIFIILFKILLGFIIAYLIQLKLKRKKMWYLLLYLPWTIPMYIKIISWRTFFQGNSGDSFFNYLFGTHVNLIANPYVTFFIACFVEVWDSLPFITTLFLGALSSIPKELLDITKIDQISEKTTIRRVIIPLIKPMILPAIVLEIIKAFGSFNVAFLLTKGYPLLPYGTNEAGVIGATDLFSTFTFYMFYKKREIGIAAAYSTIMSLITLFFVLIWIKISRGTQSAFSTSSAKNKTEKKKALLLLFSLLFSQGLLYILSGVLDFRYYGIYWSEILTYIVASLYLLAAILLKILDKQTPKIIIQIIIITDICLSLYQFCVYQMWYAFNWNMLVAAWELYYLSGFYQTSLELETSFLIKARKIIEKIKTSLNFTLYKIDSMFIDLKKTHVILVIEGITFLVGLKICSPNNIITILLTSSFMLLVVLSLFSSTITKFTILLQLLVWSALITGKFPVGWIWIIVFLSLVFVLNYIKEELSCRKFQSHTSSFSFLLGLPLNSIFILLLVIFISFIPLWNIIWIAFSSGYQLIPTSIFPSDPTLDNFKLLFTQEKIYFNFANSFLVSISSACITVLLTILGAYAFSRYNFRIKNELMTSVFTLKMFTGILTLIPLYLIIYNLGLTDTFLGVILAYSTHTIPLGLWLIKGYFDSIPKELDEVALLMGNSPRRIIRKIVLPLAGPAIAIAFLISFLNSWNGFLLAFVLLNSTDKYTLPIKLYYFVGSIENSSPQWGLFAAASLLVTLFMLIILFLLRKHLLKGLENAKNFDGE
ncbi:MAG: ABC transporter permease subunit [Candidatus Heimdallarchaeaceae archaeon]